MSELSLVGHLADFSHVLTDHFHLCHGTGPHFCGAPPVFCPAQENKHRLRRLSRGSSYVFSSNQGELVQSIPQPLGSSATTLKV